jgi:mannose-6-phosphate isomerase
MGSITLSTSKSKKEVFKEVESYLVQRGFTIEKTDDTRPWGGFFVLDEKQIKKFSEEFFSGVSLSRDQLSQKLSPKFLIVAPGARLSWQYHDRRSELWQLQFGEAGLIRSDSDAQGEIEEMKPEITVALKTGERHRLVGLNNWGVVAEIWIHQDPSLPSDEEDIVRLSDDYNRT